MAMTEVLFEKQPKKKKWWKTNRGLIIILLVLICGVLGSYIYYLRIKADTGDICTTTECMRASVAIISSIDQSVNPCDDFYSFSCGNFIKEAYETRNPFPHLAQQLRRNNQINGIIASPITGDEQTPLLLQKTFYQSCMNVSTIDEDNNRTFMKIIEELGGWPVIKGQEWDFEIFELDTMMVKCKELGLPFQWFFTITPIDQINHIKIGIPSIDSHFEDPFKEAVYFELMVETAVTMGGSRSIAKIELEKVLDFERNLVQIFKKYDFSENTVTNYDDLTLIFSNNDFSLLIEELIDEEFLFTDNTTMMVNENIMKELNLLLAGTSRRTSANFFIWKIIQDFGVLLATPIRENFGNFSTFMTKSRVMTRSQICSEESKKRFPNIAEASYIKKYVNDETVQEIKTMISNIKNRFVARINGADWISKGSKVLATEKIKNVTEIIGDQNLQFDSDLLDELLDNENLTFTSSNIIHMAREKNINDFRIKFMGKITTDELLTQFIFKTTTEVNAGFIDPANVIVISAAFIQDIFYSKQRPNYLNYGSLGMIIGHELAHGLERDAKVQIPEGKQKFMESQYNETVNEEYFMFMLNSTSLWDNETLDEIVARSTCLDDQYIEFLDEENDDVEESLHNENFADLIGIDIAYEAYHDWWKIHGNEEKALPGLTYTPKQMFWIQFATNFCYEKIIAEEYDILNRNHASFNYRVLSPLKNSRYFPLDFKCSPGTNMNSVEKCFIF
nr:neprilysin-1-like [Leptinotarsa decemlineata]